MKRSNEFEYDANGVWYKGRGDKRAPAPDPEQVAVCKEWIGRFGILTKKTKTSGRTSYRWKHIVEHRMGKYVSNGAFIQAAIECGLKIEIEHDYSPNVRVNLSKGCGVFDKGPGFAVYRRRHEAEFAKNGNPLYSGKIRDIPAIDIKYLCNKGHNYQLL